MINTAIKLPIFLSAIIFCVASCASQKDIIYLNNQVNALYRQSKKNADGFEKSIKNLEQKVQACQSEQKALEKILDENQGILKKDQESIRLHLAQLEADLVEIKDAIQLLTGRIEENSHLLKGIIEEDTTKDDAMISQMKELSSITEDLKLRIEKIERSATFKPSGEEKKADVGKKLPAQNTTQKPMPLPEEKQLTESEIYDRTLGYYRDGQYEEAMQGFKSFLRLYPESDLADNAHFWIGECYRELQRYEEAILAYQKVINGYPKGNKVPAAMLQQAFTFEKIDDRTTANLVFKKLIKNFPETKEAEIARKRLE